MLAAANLGARTRGLRVTLGHQGSGGSRDLARRSSRLRRYLSRRRLVLRSQARASSACASIAGRLYTPPLRSVPRRSLPDRLEVDLRQSTGAFFGPPVASKVAHRIKATNLSQSGAVVAFVGEDSERVRVLSYFVNASERDSYPCAAICDCGAAVILNMCFADSDGLVDLVYVAGTQPVTHAVRKYIGGPLHLRTL
jgi:hypothetical protein